MQPLTLEKLQAINARWAARRAPGARGVLSAAARARAFAGSRDAAYFRYIPCPLCGSDGYAVFHRKVCQGPRTWRRRTREALVAMVGAPLASAALSRIRGRPVQVTTRHYAVMQCASCSFLFRNPTYTDKGLDRAYNHGSYSNFLAGGYAENRRELYEYLYRQINLDERTRHFQRRRLLDFGCGFGLFLDFMRSKGWDPHGFDFSADGIELGRKRFGLEQIRSGSLDESTFQGDFDLVSMISVAAHLTDPMDTFRRIHRIVRPGGALLIWTVNAGGYEHRVAGADWNGFTPNHLVFFDQRTITSALTKAGFSRVEFGYDARQFQSLKRAGAIAPAQATELERAFSDQNLGNMLVVLATNGTRQAPA